MIQLGIDLLLRQNPSWKNNRIALVTNHAATTNTLIPSRKALLDNGFNIVRLFSPEHGLDIQGIDGAKMADGIDSLTRIPVISLYGEKLQPSAADLQDIDIVLFDIPDTGCRFYTYLWTLTYVLEACGQYQKRFIVLDRPNPLSGNLLLAEGPLLDEINCSSFTGRWSIPLRHSCTLGELSLYFNQSRKINAPVEVIRCSDWQRTGFQPAWEMPFVPTSPAIQNFATALLYPGLGLLEATNISEGRGTHTPFRLAGAPWINGREVALIFNQMALGDSIAKSISFTPFLGKYVNERCSGVEFYVKHLFSFQSVTNGLLFIKLIQDLYPLYFQWKSYPTHVNPTGEAHLDKLLGIRHSESLFNLDFQQFIASVTQYTQVKSWSQSVSSSLLYS
jgi:uncharacterized protein YbbC (DUF1343 family)